MCFTLVDLKDGFNFVGIILQWQVAQQVDTQLV